MCFFMDEEEKVNYFYDFGVQFRMLIWVVICEKAKTEGVFMHKKICPGSGDADLNILMVLCGLEMKKARIMSFYSGNFFSKLFHEQKKVKFFWLSCHSLNFAWFLKLNSV